MNYKRIFSNRDTRFKILNLLSFIPDKLMIKIQYYIKLKRLPNILNPSRFTEKLQWYKLYYRDPKMSIAADKYKVREYITEKGLNYLLVDLYDVIDSPNKINLEKLPNKFVVKTTNGSGTNIFIKNKKDLDEHEIKKQLEDWLNRNISAAGREWAYKDIEPKIIFEQFLEDEYQKDGVNDFKFLCFNGEPKYIIHDVDRFNNHLRNTYDINWNYIPVSSDVKNGPDAFPKPNQLERMIEISKILSEDFPFVRVDLYNVNGKIYFGELTFYPWTGYVQFNPDKFDLILGNEFDLPK